MYEEKLNIEKEKFQFKISALETIRENLLSENRML